MKTRIEKILNKIKSKNEDIENIKMSLRIINWRLKYERQRKSK